MLKDKKGNWVEILKIPEELCKKIVQETLKGILRLLDSAQILLDNGGDEAVCAGLYTYALEEYGKILLLKQTSHVAGEVEIEYRKGFRCHRRKFRLALENLPNECKTLYEADFDAEDFESSDFETEDIIADFEARMAVFYSDFTDSGRDIKPVPPVDTKLLRNAMNTLQTIALRTDFNIC